MTMIPRVFMLIFFLCGQAQAAHAWTVELSEADLQERIDKRLPIEKNKLLFTVLVSALKVELTEGSERIGMVADMEIKSPHLSSGKGRARLDGKLRYQATDGAFYFQEVEVREVTFENIPDKYHGLVRELFQHAVQRRLAETPVYQLDTNKTKQQIAKALLKSVRVMKGKLVLELSFF